MKVTKKDMKTKCPGCGSTNIYTHSLDQFCLVCDWSNSLMLVEKGQLDQPLRAAYQHFAEPLEFSDLPDEV